MWAPKKTLSFHPHPMEARSTKQAQGSKKQKPRDRGQKQLIWLSKKDSLGPAQIHAGPKKISPQGPENRQARPHAPHIFCAPRSKKKNQPCQKNMYKSKKGCPGPMSKKHASRLIYCSTMLPKASPTARKCSEVSLTRCRATARNHVIVQQSWNDQVLAHNAWAANGSLGGIADDASTKGLPKRPCLVQNRGESFCDLSGHWMFALLN